LQLPDLLNVVWHCLDYDYLRVGKVLLCLLGIYEKIAFFRGEEAIDGRALLSGYLPADDLTETLLRTLAPLFVPSLNGGLACAFER